MIATGDIDPDPYLQMGVVATLLVWADVMAGEYEDPGAGKYSEGSAALPAEAIRQQASVPGPRSE